MSDVTFDGKFDGTCGGLDILTPSSSVEVSSLIESSRLEPLYRGAGGKCVLWRD